MNMDGTILRVPGEFWTDGKQRPFTVDSHLHCTRFVWKKANPETENMQKISSCDSENTICTGTDLLHNANNSRFEPLFTPVHICKNTDSYFMSLRFMAFTYRLILSNFSFGTSWVHHSDIICVIVCLGLCLVTYNRHC